MADDTMTEHTMAGRTAASLAERVAEAVGTVDDPELPGISIVDLGLVERLDVDAAGHALVGLIPTYSGCPALAAIRHDVATAVAAVPGVVAVDVEFLASPAWTVDRVSAAARRRLAGELGVAVQVGRHVTTCPRCGAPTDEVSVFGPTRCRAVHRCVGCGEVVEVMR